MARRYRRRSAASSILNDSAYIFSRLPWWGALIFGLISFVVFYYLFPAWLESKLSHNQNSNIYPALEALIGRRIYLFHWLGIACGLLGCFFSLRNYIVKTQAGYKERGIVSFIAKMLGRNIE